MFLKTLDKKQKFSLKNLNLFLKNKLALRFTWQMNLNSEVRNSESGIIEHVHDLMKFWELNA